MIDISEFHKENPKTSEKLLPGNYASSAVNCDLESGDLQPIKGVSAVLSIDAGAETIYRMGESWLQWNNKINIIESLVHNSGGRIVFTGDSYPKETNLTLALTSAPYPTATRRLGIAAPTTAPSYSITVTGTGTDRSVAYCYTRIGEWADGTVVESAPSSTTAVFTAKDDATVRLTGFTDASETGVYTTHYRIYRINTGNTGAEYQYVDDLDKTASPLQYDDDHTTNTDDSLGEVLPSDGWTDPDDDLKGIISTSNGLVFAFNDNTVYPSESFIPYAFPDAYSLSVASEIVGLGDNGNAVVVLTKTTPFLIYGSDPSALSLEKTAYEWPCKSARSIVSIPGGVIYASVTGFILIDSGGNAINLTKDIFTKTQWESLGPENSFAFFYNDAYVAFFSGTLQGIEIKPGENAIRRFTLEKKVYGGQYVSTVSINTYDFLTSASSNFLTIESYQFKVSGASYSLTYDTLYLIQATDSARGIVSWNTGSLVDYTWQSKEEYIPSDQVLTAGMISGDFTNGNVTIKLYVDDTLVFTKEVSDETIFRITPARGNKFQIKLTGKATVDRVILGASIPEVMKKIYG